MDAIATDATVTEENSTETVTTDMHGRVLDLRRHGHHFSTKTEHPSTSVFATVVNVSGAPNVETRVSSQLRTTLLLTLKVSKETDIQMTMET